MFEQETIEGTGWRRIRQIAEGDYERDNSLRSSCFAAVSRAVLAAWKPKHACNHKATMQQLFSYGWAGPGGGGLLYSS